uniref:PGG domain-containing protein n=1 Tax=Hordeum vulgare subsp. vulgare TaxID=112509 RepID=A0A8I6XJD2_HORVV
MWHYEMVSLLVNLAQNHEHGPGAARVLMLRNNGGETVLHVAARHSRQEVAERLIVAAPSLSCGVNDAGVSPLYLAVLCRSAGIVRALVGCPHAPASASGPSRQNALHAAVLQSAEITHAILAWNLNLANETDESGSSPLHYAASDGDRRIIGHLLIFAPSALYLQDQQGFTPLHMAAWMGHVDVIHDMLQASPHTAEVTDNNGRNFLHVAIGRGHESIVKYIVGSPFASGLVNEQDNDGNTPLHLAVIARKPKLSILHTEFLELNIANNEGRTPFDLVSDITSFLPMIGFVLKLSARHSWIGTRSQDRVLPWNDTAMKEWLEKLSKNLGIVAVLIATIALTAMFNVPGGYDSKGMPNLRGTRHTNTFLVLDTVAMASSMIATMLLIYGRGASARSSATWICLALIFLWCALMGMILSFMAAVVPGLENDTIMKKMVWCIFALPFFSLVALSFVWAEPAPTIASVRLLYHARTSQDRVRMRRHTRRRFPMVGFYLFVLYLFWFLNAGAFALTLHVIMITL